jgi:hypothetical protein
MPPRTPTNAKPFSTFHPDQCCEHSWHASDGCEVCPKCHALCARDDEGKIVSYARPSPGVADNRLPDAGERPHNSIGAR